MCSLPVLQVRRMLAGEEELLDKLTQALLDSYIDDNKRVKWCPSVPHCGRAIQVRAAPAAPGPRHKA